MTDDESPSRLQLGDEAYDSAADYIQALRAALRTHQRLTDGEPLTIEISTDEELPLVQRMLLR